MDSSTEAVKTAEPTAPNPPAFPDQTTGNIPRPTHDFGFLPIPKRLRYDPEKPFHFGHVLNICFGFACTFTVANLHYSQPLLIEYSKSFDVTYSEASTVPTLIQAGYAIGLVLISPLGDVVRRRQLILLLVLISTSLTVGVSVTRNFRAFEGLCFLLGLGGVTPQVLIPLAADLAPPHRRAAAVSVVFSGLMLGILVARVLAGVIANFDSWRIVYYMAIGVQCVVLVGAYFILPDYPAKNPELTYFNILYTMTKFAITEPLMIQAVLINSASSACYMGFWVTLTFLLGGAPYYYSTLIIGLFGLVGMLGVCVTPMGGRLIDRLVPWYATLVATCLLIVFQAVQTGAGGINIAAVIIACFGIDVGRQMQQVSLATAVFTIDNTARARLNAVLILSTFVGQVIGTAAGSKVFLQYGWRTCAVMMMALFGFQLAILLLRGPHCPRNHWFGWAGGVRARRLLVVETQKEDDSSNGSNDATSTEALRPSEKIKMEDETV